jgi:hypothetical protein
MIIEKLKRKITASYAFDKESVSEYIRNSSNSIVKKKVKQTKS